jgi:hypothetical protein
VTDLFRPAKGVSEEYLKINKLGKVPTFVGADGYTLHEAIAIAIYSESRNLYLVVICVPTKRCYDEKTCQQLSLS